MAQCAAAGMLNPTLVRRIHLTHCACWPFAPWPTAPTNGQLTPLVCSGRACPRRERVLFACATLPLRPEGILAMPTMTLVRLAQEEQEQRGSFDPEAIAVMTTAFERLLSDLKLTQRDDPVVQMVAKLVIELVRNGQRDPQQIRQQILGRIGPSRPPAK
jgi:hypothetical protein